MSTKLTRSRTDKFAGGVCGGLAEYFKIDATFIRIGAVVLQLLFQVALPVYALLWLILPYEDGGPTGFDSLKSQLGR